MGACLSTSTMSTCSSRSNGEARHPSPRLGLRFYGRKRTKRTFSDHAMTLQHLGSIPNRVFANGKSSSSCIFTQQGCKGINQDAMLVREDFMTEDKLKSMKDGSADEDQLNSMWSLVSYYVIPSRC
ncbi:Probable protein phosphatase 2C 52 [Linum perenne]